MFPLQVLGDVCSLLLLGGGLSVVEGGRGLQVDGLFRVQEHLSDSVQLFVLGLRARASGHRLLRLEPPHHGGGC